jgi:hypothetical protein
MVNVDSSVALTGSEMQGHAGSGGLSFLHSFVFAHLSAAARAAGRMSALERANNTAEFGPWCDEMLHEALTIATSSVAALESYANDLLFEGRGLGDDLNRATKELCTRVKKIDRLGILEKFDLVLAVGADIKLASDRRPTQDVAKLIRLRNAAVHFRPERSHEANAHRVLSAELKPCFQPLPVYANHLLFPTAWTSHSFAAWAIKSTVAFIDLVHAHVGRSMDVLPEERRQVVAKLAEVKIRARQL